MADHEYPDHLEERPGYRVMDRVVSRTGTVLLLLGMLIVGGFVIRSEMEQRELLSEFSRLRRLTAELTVEDLDKIYFVAMPTEDPAEFAWRIYLPPEETYRWSYTTMGGSSSVSGSPSLSSANDQHIARFRIAVHDGILQRFSIYSQGGSYSTFGTSEIARLFTSPQDDLAVRQRGVNGQEDFSRWEVVSLLELQFSDSFRQRARDTLDDVDSLKFVEEWSFVLRLGTEDAFSRAAENQDNREQNPEPAR